MTDALSVLLVEDNPTHARMVAETLREIREFRIELQTVDTLRRALDAIGTSRFDVVLLDLNLPDSNGADTIRAMNAAAPRIPIIALSGLEDRKTEHEAVWLGAQDFLIKGEASPRQFARSLFYAIERKRIQGGMEQLIRLATDVLATESVNDLLRAVADAARTLSSAKLGIADHGYARGHLRVGTAPGKKGFAPRQPEMNFPEYRNGLFAAIVRGRGAVRLTDAQLRMFPDWNRLPEKHPPLRGLLGVALYDRYGKPGGLIMVSDKESGDFTEDDEILLRQLASITSLALQHIEARTEAQELAANAERGRRTVERQKFELELAIEELESFSFSISHDLRTPLRVISGFAELLLEETAGKLGPELHGHLLRINKGVSVMNRIIDDLMRLTGVSRHEIRLQLVDVSALARSIADDLRQRQPEREVDIVIGETPGADADSGLLALALSNLIGNAWKFTNKTEHPRIEFGAKREGAGIVYYVRDNGAGFDQKEAATIFRPFRRLHSEREFEGTGIGLATVARVIRRHGGKIWAEGQKGRGATIYFTLKPSSP